MMGGFSSVTMWATFCCVDFDGSPTSAVVTIMAADPGRVMLGPMFEVADSRGKLPGRASSGPEVARWVD